MNIESKELSNPPPLPVSGKGPERINRIGLLLIFLPWILASCIMFVIRDIVGFYKDIGRLPSCTQLLVDITNFLSHYSILLIPFGIPLVAGFAAVTGIMCSKPERKTLRIIFCATGWLIVIVLLIILTMPVACRPTIII